MADQTGTPIPDGATIGTPEVGAAIPQGAQVGSPNGDGTFSSALKGFWSQVGPTFDPRTYMGTPNSLPGSVKGAMAIPGQEKDAQADAQKTFADPKSSESDKFDSIVHMIPLVGPQLKQMDDLHKQGKDGEAYGQMAGMMAQILGPHVMGKMGTMGADLADAAATKVSPNVSKVMNQYVGLQPSDLAKFQRTIPNLPEDIGDTVYKEAVQQNGGKIPPTLPKMKDAIDGRIKQLVAAQEAKVQGTMSHAPSTDLTHMLLDHSINLMDEINSKYGPDPAKTGAVSHNLDNLNTQYGGMANPEQMLQMRRNIKPDSFDPNTPNIDTRYKQMLYHDLNDKITGALPPDQAAQFRQTNNVIHRLIIASEAAGEKISKGNMKAEAVTKSASRVISPSKIVEAVPNDAALRHETAARQALSGGLKAGATAVRNTIGNPTFNSALSGAGYVAGNQDRGSDASKQ